MMSEGGHIDLEARPAGERELTSDIDLIPARPPLHDGHHSKAVQATRSTSDSI